MIFHGERVCYKDEDGFERDHQPILLREQQAILLKRGIGIGGKTPVTGVFIPEDVSIRFNAA